MKTNIFYLFAPFMILLLFANCKAKNERVEAAFKEKKMLLAQNLATLGLKLDNVHILFIAYKQENELEMYAKKANEISYKKLITYPICAKSGSLGPKRKEGDRQIPEGFYCISRFNPASTYYLSLGLNYPNESDKIKSNAPELGGDIYIHGECVTIGCLPMTNDKIKEIYLYALAAKENGQVQIPVYIFPFRFTAENTEKYYRDYAENEGLIPFWENLRVGYNCFENNKRALVVKVNENGNYVFAENCEKPCASANTKSDTQ